MEVNPGSGPGGVAATGSFRVLSQAPTILVQGAGQVVDAMTITVQENTYSVVFSFTISRADWLGVGTQNAAALYAGFVQGIAALTYVTAIAYAQDVNAAGLLVDTLIVTVGTPDGLQSAIATVPLLTADSLASATAIADAYANLTTVAAAT